MLPTSPVRTPPGRNFLNFQLPARHRFQCVSAPPSLSGPPLPGLCSSPLPLFWAYCGDSNTLPLLPSQHHSHSRGPLCLRTCSQLHVPKRFFPLSAVRLLLPLTELLKDTHLPPWGQNLVLRSKKKVLLFIQIFIIYMWH